MCGRYWIAQSEHAEDWSGMMASLARLPSPAGAKDGGEIFPSDIVPVIANNRKLSPSVFWMKWGMSIEGSKLLINARSETASSKPLFRDGMKQRRCLIPASHYFEWGKHDRARYEIKTDQNTVMYMAGLYRIEGNQPCFVILTKEAAAEIAFIHHRMPVMLSVQKAADWLNPNINADQVIKEAGCTPAYKPSLTDEKSGQIGF